MLNITFSFYRRVHTNSHTWRAHPRDLANLRVPVTLSLSSPPSSLCTNVLHTHTGLFIFIFFILFSIFDEPNSHHSHHAHCRKINQKKSGLYTFTHKTGREPFLNLVSACQGHPIPSQIAHPNNQSRSLFSMSQPTPFPCTKFQIPPNPHAESATRFSLDLGEFNPPAEGGKGKAESVKTNGKIRQISIMRVWVSDNFF